MRPLNSELREAHGKRWSYSQSLLRFGLPVIILYRAQDYFWFRVIDHNPANQYSWRFYLALDIPVTLFMAAFWQRIENKRWARKCESNSLETTP